MLRALVDFFRTGPDRPVFSQDRGEIRRVYERKRWSVFLSVTIGYGMFYVARVNWGIVKKPMLDEGVFTATQMGDIGAALLYAYAAARFVNGFLADRCNIARFMSTGLLLSALVNLALGWTTTFWAFLALWGFNGWFQATGSAPSVVSLSHWFSKCERGTRYGVWSLSHGIGEGISYAATALLVAAVGWRWGFWGPGLLCLATAVVLFRTLQDRPETYGLPSVARYRRDPTTDPAKDRTVWREQLVVFRNPALWVLGLAAAAMYVARYGINNWGVLYLQEAKGYSLAGAGVVLGVYPLFGLVGAGASGFFSDRFFGASRNLPCLLYGLGVAGSLALLFLTPPGHKTVDTFALALFGFALGGQLVFLGGLMAVDIASQKAAGAAMGLIGVFSYLGAGIQDSVTGRLLEASKTVFVAPVAESYGAVVANWMATGPFGAVLAPLSGGVTRYDFTQTTWFWLIAAALSVLLAALVWRQVAAGLRPREDGM